LLGNHVREEKKSQQDQNSNNIWSGKYFTLINKQKNVIVIVSSLILKALLF